MIPIRHIQQATADHYEITRTDILGPSRQEVFCHPRQLAMSIARAQGYSFPQIGHAFKRDHTTILNAIARVEEREGVHQNLARSIIIQAAEKAKEREALCAGQFVFRTSRKPATFTTQQRA